MKAQDIMSREVISVAPDTPVREIAALMTEKRISGVPVVSADGKLAGIISESDLLRRAEMGTEPRRKWWLKFFSDPDQMAREYTKIHGLKARDIMTREVVTVAADADLKKIADTFVERRIKRVPVVSDGKLAGIISRADVVKALSRVASEAPKAGVVIDDGALERTLAQRMREQDWLDSTYISVAVANGVVQLRGFIGSTDQRRALRVLLEETPGVRGIDDQLTVGMPAARAS
jgi:CBS domain-containing protein